ncbi:hypothetical protein C8J57DRAFT_1220611 [Mycena rebaudengoi]|nr:hypothetical protein C8J57DRAFT_1220611 [Mycena rebaudengoi]
MDVDVEVRVVLGGGVLIGAPLHADGLAGFAAGGEANESASGEAPPTGKAMGRGERVGRSERHERADEEVEGDTDARSTAKSYDATLERTWKRSSTRHTGTHADADNDTGHTAQDEAVHTARDEADTEARDPTQGTSTRLTSTRHWTIRAPHQYPRLPPSRNIRNTSWSYPSSSVAYTSGRAGWLGGLAWARELVWGDGGPATPGFAGADVSTMRATMGGAGALTNAAEGAPSTSGGGAAFLSAASGVTPLFFNLVPNTAISTLPPRVLSRTFPIHSALAPLLVFLVAWIVFALRPSASIRPPQSSFGKFSLFCEATLFKSTSQTRRLTDAFSARDRAYCTVGNVLCHKLFDEHPCSFSAIAHERHSGLMENEQDGMLPGRRQQGGEQGGERGTAVAKGLSPAFSAKSTPPLASWERGGAGS